MLAQQEVCTQHITSKGQFLLALPVKDTCLVAQRILLCSEFSTEGARSRRRTKFGSPAQLRAVARLVASAVVSTAVRRAAEIKPGNGQIGFPCSRSTSARARRQPNRVPPATIRSATVELLQL